MENCRKTLEDFDAGLIDVAGNSTSAAGPNNIRSASRVAFQQTAPLRSRPSSISSDIEMTYVRSRAASMGSNNANQESESSNQIVDLTMED
jgi:hypothetical protein